MKKPALLEEIAGRLMRRPAAPYHEDGPAGEVRRICAEHRLPVEVDEFGNLLVRIGRGGDRRPVALAAHLDHPGFIVGRRLRAGHWQAEFLGGVGDAYFKAGVPLRLQPGGEKALLGPKIGPRVFELHGDAPEARFAVWDLPDFELRAGQIVGRACDDLIGAAAILAVLIDLRRAKVNAIGVFSRAEEVGFHGALALAGTGRLAKETLVISLETSRELPPVEMGAGVIVRVGDKASVFSSRATRFLSEVAGQLQKRAGGFQFQRALMPGGTCEGTAYQEYGYECAAVCVALGNYHNCGPGDAIRAEYVSADDARAMVDLLAAAVRAMPDFERLAGALPKRLAKLRAAAVKKLVQRPSGGRA